MRFKLLFIALCFIAHASFAKVTVNLSQKSAGINEDFTVTFTYQGSNGRSNPDFSKLKKDFTILRSSQNSQISIINGKIRRQMEWRLMLNAKQAGKYNIPAISFGNEKSLATKIYITKKNTLPSSDQQNNIFMKAEVNNLKPYVQQQITYKVRMFYRIRPTSGDFTTPNADNALLTPIGESQNYQTNIKGQTYYVVEQNYAIFAEQPGPLSIQSPMFKGLIRSTNINDINQIMMDLHQPIKIAAANVKLDVQAIPQSFNGATWLPAGKVTLDESWQQTNQEIKMGQPITRIVRLKAIGLMASQLPELTFGTAIKGAKVYAEPSTSKDQVAASRIIGEKEFKIVYIPTGKQDLIIPEIKISWWDLDNKKLKIAMLNQKQFTISNKSIKKNHDTNDLKINTNSSKINSASDKKPSNNHITKPQQNPYFSKTTLIPWLLVLVLILTILIYRFKSKAKANISKLNNSCPIKALKKQFKKSCMENNATVANQNLMQWAKLNYPAQTIRQLNDLKQITNNNLFIKELNILQHVLYSPAHEWHGQALWQAFLTINNKKYNTTNNKNDSLPMFNY